MSRSVKVKPLLISIMSASSPGGGGGGSSGGVTDDESQSMLTHSPVSAKMEVVSASDAPQDGIGDWCRQPVALQRRTVAAGTAACVLLLAVATLSGGTSGAAADGIDLFGNPVSPASAFEFDDIFSGSLRPSSLSGAQWVAAEHLASEKDGALQLYSPAAQSWTVLVPQAVHQAFQASSWSLSPDGTKVLYACDSVSVYRHSRTSNYRIYIPATAQTFEVDPSGPQAAAIWCPFSQHIAYVQNHNVYMVELATGVRTTVTTDGQLDGVVRNGDADWVYEEEILAGSGAMYFSEETMALAYLRFDDSEVPDYDYTYWGETRQVIASSGNLTSSPLSC